MVGIDIDTLIDANTIGMMPSETTNNGKQQPTAPYAIPPVVWMFAFLVIGYFGLKWLMED